MKKIIVVILSVILLIVVFLFTFGNFKKEKNGLGYKYYNSLEFLRYAEFQNGISEFEKITRFKHYSSEYTLYYRIDTINENFTTVGYLRHYPVTYHGSQVAESYRLHSSDIEVDVILDENKNLIDVRIPINAKFFVQSLNSNSNSFQRGYMEFSLFDDIHNNFATWTVDFIIELFNFIRGIIADFGGAFIV